MANIFRGPLYVNRREVAPVLGLRGVAPSALLLTLAVAVIAIPPGAQSLPLQSISKPLTFNADTSHGTPKTLTADKQLPFFVAPHFAPPPHRPGEWLNPDESAGTPKPLTTDKQLPFFVAPHFPQLQHPRLEWLPADTSQDMPSVLRPVAAPAPFVVAPPLVPLRFWWQPPDSTCDTPKPLFGDGQPPFMLLQQPLVKQWWQPADTTCDTPKSLFGDATLPRNNLPYPSPDAIRPVTDTSQSAYGPTHAIAVLALPPGAANWLGVPQYTWQFGDTTLESPPVAIQGVAPAPPAVVTTPLQGGARPPWGGTKKRRYVRIGNKEYVVSNERDVEYLINRELSKPIVPGKPKGKPSKVVAPDTFEQKVLNPVSVEIALRSQDEALIAIIKRLIAEHDETDIEIILLTL